MNTAENVTTNNRLGTRIRRSEASVRSAG